MGQDRPKSSSAYDRRWEIHISWNGRIVAYVADGFVVSVADVSYDQIKTSSWWPIRECCMEDGRDFPNPAE